MSPPYLSHLTSETPYILLLVVRLDRTFRLTDLVFLGPRKISLFQSKPTTCFLLQCRTRTASVPVGGRDFFQIGTLQRKRNGMMYKKYRHPRLGSAVWGHMGLGGAYLGAALHD